MTPEHPPLFSAGGPGHNHAFDSGNRRAEKRTRIVMWITLLTMSVEIGAGWLTGSMALMADGWHMSSHAFAIGLASFAYTMARRYADDSRFAFGTWKIEILGSFASALFMLAVAAMMVGGSLERLYTPAPIHFKEAIVVAALGLVVNLVCAFILGHDGEHEHHHGHQHEHGHGAHGHDHAHHDLNLRAAYLDVLADAATSILAIAALTGGWLWGWNWLDPAMGLVGALLVANWARALLKESSRVLLDREMDSPLVAEVKQAVEDGDSRIIDLHLWRVGRQNYNLTLSLLSQDAALTPEAVHLKLAAVHEVVHATVEIHLRPAGAASGEGLPSTSGV